MALTKVSNSMLVQPVNHNILINPSFTVFQRAGTTASGEWGVDHANASYGPDRWKVKGLDGVGGTKVESSTEVDDATGINKLVVKHEGTITSAAYVLQRIEAVNLQGLYGKEMTFSFGYSDTAVLTVGSGIPFVNVVSWDSAGSSKDVYNAIPTSLGNNRWTCTFTLSTNDGTVPDPSERGMQLRINPNEGATVEDVASEWSVWETKLEVGSVVTPFIARSHGEELALCQRYYWQNTTQGAYYFYQYVSTNRMLFIPFPVTMRATPTPDVVSDSPLVLIFASDEYQYKAYNSVPYTETAAYSTSSVKFDAEL